MAEEVKDGGAPAPADEVKNLKSEFSRKLSNLEESNKALQQTQAALLAQLQSLQPKPEPAKAESLADLMYKDPDAYAKRVLEEADRRAEAKLNERAQAQQRQNQVIASLVSEFPELNDGDHDFTKAAVAKFNAMSDDMKNSPVAYKTAVMEAALEAGLKPKSKRERTESDDYVGSGGGSSSSRTRTKKNELDPRTAAFAELVGLDINKPGVKERLSTNHGRDTYLKWK